jgi:hypothetical protein
MPSTHLLDRARTERLGYIRADLMRRIRPACREMPQDLFLELVETMARIQLKYELRNAQGER